MRIGSLFSGIGGLDLGLEMSGLGETVWQVEQNPYCRKVLARHWPNAERFEDVKEVGKHNLAPVDIICGGFPCQDISSAGKGAGLAGSRSGLWYEYARIIDELRPEWVIVENVASGAKRWVDAVCEHLGVVGYKTLPVPLSAKDVGAPHLRKRIFLIAHAVRKHLREQPKRARYCECGQGAALAPKYGETGHAAHPCGAGLQNGGVSCGAHTQQPEHPSSPWSKGPTVSPVCGVDDGLPDKVQRLRALGNAVVPQCAEVIGYMVQELINETR